MRALSSLCLLLVACGDNLKYEAPRADAPGLDAPELDAPVDAPPGVAGSRVWVVGDILTDQQDLAAAFTHGTGTLPYGPGNEPPLRIPRVRAFDARGTRIAYVADASMAGRFDLHVASADNTGAVIVAQAAGLGVDITSVALSPDGTKVAFTRDSVLVNDGFDLWVAPTIAGATPVKVSPDRGGSLMPDQQDVSTAYTWSADGRYLAFAGDLEENGYDQVYVVDTTAAAPTAVELLRRADIATQPGGAQGVRGPLQFDSANNVYFRARIQPGSTQFQLFRATVAGARTPLSLPPRAGGASIPDAGAFSISPDGSKLVFSADAPMLGHYDLYVAATASPTPTRLTQLAAPGNASFIAPIAFSPDGTRIAVVADFLAGDGNDEPFVIHLDGSTQAPRRLVSFAASCPGCTNVDADSIQWTADSAAVYVRGGLTSSNDIRVFRLDPGMADQPPALAVTTPANGDVTSLLVRPIP
jgi:hypothetical protein